MAGGQSHFYLSDEPTALEDATDAYYELARRLVEGVEGIPKETQQVQVWGQHELQEVKLQLAHTMTCAIYGRWGTGKTTFLRTLQRQFELEGRICLWFEPWRYENEHHLLLPLLVELHALLRDELREEQLKKTAWETTKMLVGRLGRALARGASEVVQGHTGVNLLELGESLMKAYGDQVAMSDWSTKLSEVEGFRHDYERLLGLAAAVQNRRKGETRLGRLLRKFEGNTKKRLEKAGAKGREAPEAREIVVLIDDLDRCGPNQVRRLLESIKVFLTVPGVFYFLALDERQVQRALLATFEPLAEDRNEALERTKLYLGKFFQHHVDLDDGLDTFLLPAVKALRKKLEKSIRELVTADSVDRYIAVFDDIDDHPRALKRAVRWLFYETRRTASCDRILLHRFAELALCLNWPRVWVNDFQTRDHASRARVYRAVLELLRPVPDSGAIAWSAAWLGKKHSELTLQMQSRPHLQPPNDAWDEVKQKFQPSENNNEKQDHVADEKSGPSKEKWSVPIVHAPDLAKTLAQMLANQEGPRLAKLGRLCRIAAGEP